MSVSLDLAAKQTFKKGGRVIKLSKNMKPFVSNVVRHGRVQMAFKEAAKSANACVSGTLKGQTGLSGRVVHGVVKLCSAQFPATLGIGGGRRARRKVAAEEYFEIE